ncbi:MAG: glycerol-3-phosphate 1-O-acyltransferase PlsY [Chloroflexi bacterium]|nr:glycerol-3-phosphate 1-O-acyltransferase PlsY [Chloroflexota bacterium]
MAYFVAILVAYLLGSIPFGVLVVRLVKKVDVREYGSGVTGATNVLRTAGPGPAVVALVGDLGKGALAVLIARLLSDAPVAHALAGIAVAVGHIWPVFARFRGGRGVLTGLGGTLVLAPWAGLAAVAVFLPVVAVSRFVSLGSITAATTAFVVVVGTTLAGSYPMPYLAFALVVGPLLVLRHGPNIQRLIKGTEHRLGQRARSRKPEPEA